MGYRLGARARSRVPWSPMVAVDPENLRYPFAPLLFKVGHTKLKSLFRKPQNGSTGVLPCYGTILRDRQTKIISAALHTDTSTVPLLIKADY